MAWVPIRAGALVYAIPEMTAALLEQSLRDVHKWDAFYADAATSAADRIRSFVEGESSAAIEFEGDGRTIVAKIADGGLLAGPHESATIRAIIAAL